MCPECACFISSLRVKKNSRFAARNFRKLTLDNRNDFRASCHEFACESNNKLFVKIGDKKILCHHKRGKIVPGYEGVINCPPAEVICHEKFKCKYGCTENMTIIKISIYIIGPRKVHKNFQYLIYKYK